MLAMRLHMTGHPLEPDQVPCPQPGRGQVLVQVEACAVCRTDLHVVDGELPRPRLPVTPGHEVAGRITALGDGVAGLQVGDRVGVPWLGATCGTCRWCRAGQENLCPEARFTGYTLDGGYAEYIVADQRYCLPLPDAYSAVEAAPLLCAGLIGYRCLRKTGEGRLLGLYGFGAAAHIVAQIARFQGRRIFAFTRPGDRAAQQFALHLGAEWAGDSDRLPPEPMDAAIIFAPVGALVPAALRAVRPRGVVVCGGIHMSDIPSFPYELLWRERRVESVANLTRQDGVEFMEIAPQIPVRTHTRTYPLAEANQALADLREGRLQGAAVLVP